MFGLPADVQHLILRFLFSNSPLLICALDEADIKQQITSSAFLCTIALPTCGLSRGEARGIVLDWLENDRSIAKSQDRIGLARVLSKATHVVKDKELDDCFMLWVTRNWFHLQTNDQELGSLYVFERCLSDYVQSDKMISA